jgi:hypothetical protein
MGERERLRVMATETRLWVDEWSVHSWLVSRHPEVAMYLSYILRWEVPRKQVLLHEMKQYDYSPASGRESSRLFVDTIEVSFRQRHFIPCIVILLRRRVHRYMFNSYTIFILHPGSSCEFVDVESSIHVRPGAAVAFSAGSLTPPHEFLSCMYAVRIGGFSDSGE